MEKGGEEDAGMDGRGVGQYRCEALSLNLALVLETVDLSIGVLLHACSECLASGDG